MVSRRAWSVLPPVWVVAVACFLNIAACWDTAAYTIDARAGVRVMYPARTPSNHAQVVEIKGRATDTESVYSTLFP